MEKTKEVELLKKIIELNKENNSCLRKEIGVFEILMEVGLSDREKLVKIGNLFCE